VNAIPFPFGVPGTPVNPIPAPLNVVAVTTPDKFIFPFTTNEVEVTTPVVLMERSPFKDWPEGIVAPLVNSTGPVSLRSTILFTLKVDIYQPPYTTTNVLPTPTVTVAFRVTGPNIA